MNGWQQKRFLKNWKRKRIATWQLVVLLILLLCSTAFFLRQNNVKMIELRNLVLQADEEQSDVAGALERLNAHVFSHMNTEIVRPIELVHTYNAQAKKVLEDATRGSGRDIYAEATAVCERQGVPPTVIAQCAANYALENNTSIDPANIKLPDKNQFTYSFAAPLWTPDMAGFSLLLSIVTVLWLLIRCIEYIGVRLVLKKRSEHNFS